MLDYTLMTLRCWSCPATFDVFTDLSAHHLEAHESLLRGRRVATWLEEWPGTLPLPIGVCTCGCAYAIHQPITAEAPLQPCAGCPCRAFVLALRQTPALPPPQPATQEV